MRVVGWLVPGRYQLVLTHRGRGGATKVERHEVQIR
jgi:hypothetical protein